MLSYTYGRSETFCWCYLGLDKLKPKPSHCKAAFSISGQVGYIFVSFFAHLKKLHTNLQVSQVDNGLKYMIHRQTKKLVL